MKIKYLLPVVAVAAMATSCSEDEFEGTTPKVEGNDVIEASMGGETRTELSTTDNETINWTSGDKITVYTATEASGNGGKITYTLTGGEGTNSGSFTGSYSVADNGKKLLAFYPADATGLTFTATTETTPAYTISYTVPAEYTYDSSKPASLQGFPMVGVFSDDAQANVSFKNAAAVLDVTIKNVPAGYSYVEVEAQDVTADNSTTTAPYLNGTGTITFSDNTPLLAINAAGTKKTTTKWTASETVLESVRVIIPLPEATYPKLVLTLCGSDKTPLELKSWTDLGKVSRSERIASTITLDNVDASMKVVANAANATAALADATAPATSVCVLSLAETDGNTISLPANQDASSQSALTLQLSSVATAVTIDTTVASTTGKIVAAALEIKAAPATADVSVPSLTLDVPTTTVTLTPIGENGTVTYGTVTVNTDLDSLIIGKGVTVNNLVIKSGNVIVKDGGAIATSATLDTDVTSGAIYYHATSSPVTNAATGITVAPVDLFNILQGGKVKLSQDISVATPITISKNLELDLNGHNITLTSDSYNFLRVTGASDQKITASISNTSTTEGTISGVLYGLRVLNAKLTLGAGVKVTETQSSNTSYGADSHWAVLVDNGGELIIDGATIYDNIFAGVVLYPDLNVNAKLEVKSGKITGKSYGITGNGNCKSAENTTIEISGGEISNTNQNNSCPAIYHPQNGSLTIKGGTISGTDTGLEIRGGEATISGGTISAANTSFVAEKNGNGTTIQGVAIAVSQHSTDLDTKVTIKDGATITAASGMYAIYEKDLQNETARDKIKLDIQGGTINGKIYSENVTDFITGGTFSDMASAVPYATGTANKAASITLSADQTIASLTPLFSGVKKNLVVDLGSKEITVTTLESDEVAPEALDGNETSLTNYGSLTLKNGKITYSGNPGGNHFAILFKKGKLTLDGITLKAEYWGSAIGAQEQYVQFNVSNSTITGKYYSVSSNANGTYGENAHATYENVTFDSPETGYMNNVPATVSFKNCTFKGSHQGALLRGGTYTFDGTNTLELNAIYKGAGSGTDETTDCHNTTEWSSGNMTAFAPLVLGNRSATAAWQFATDVTFVANSSTTVQVSGTYAANYPGVYVWANSGTDNGVKITGASNLTVDNSVTCTPQIQYGSSNIKVDGSEVSTTTITTPGATTTTETSNATNTSDANS